jgi:hypothetical protein
MHSLVGCKSAECAQKAGWWSEGLTTLDVSSYVHKVQRQGYPLKFGLSIILHSCMYH